ncbi:hypothetical protein FS837_001827 [Tulasnella sp. UAMH 9824]|nr:hypothetical protein FS837_001827 [Tulasnella sp. UAMH 9824]
MHIHALPAETLLQILGHLPIQSICTLESVSRAFHKLINGNLNAIYLVAARLHRFLPQTAAPCGPQTVHKIAVASLGLSKWQRDIRDWKQFCKTSFLFEQSWLSLPPCEDRPVYRRMKFLTASNIQSRGDFKVDEVERTVITSTVTGEIEVSSIETGEQLWRLQEGPPQATGIPLPMEFEKGFLLCSEFGSNIIDVWRRSADCYLPHSYLPSRPTDNQLARLSDAATAFSFGYPPIDGSSNERTSPLTTCSLQTTAQLPRQGVFLPFAQIKYQSLLSRYRYTHPYLAILRKSLPKKDLSVVDIWHLPTLQRLARLCVDRDIGSVVDIAIGPNHLYVAASHRIAAYEWTPAISDESGEPVFLRAYPQFVMPQPHTDQLPMFLCERINRADAQKSIKCIADPDNIGLFTSFALPTELQ